MTHDLKTVQPYFDAVASGAKTFEIRKNDRGFEVGHHLFLREYQDDGEGFGDGYTGRATLRRITYITDFPDGLREGYVVMGIDKPEPLR